MAHLENNGLNGPKFDGSKDLEIPPDMEKRLSVPLSDTHNGTTRNGSIASETGPSFKPVQRYEEGSMDSSFTDGDDGDDGKDEDDEVDIAPDGGWGWVVCFGSFSVNFILDGTLFSFGVLMLALVSDLGEDKSTTSWIGSAQMGLHLIMGPAISIMLQKYSIRQVVVVGSICSAFAFFVSIFSPNIFVLIFTYGVCGGIAFGMVFLPGLIALVPYFDKKRAIATGIATSGSGLGTFAYGWIVDELLEAYNWRGTVLILSGLLLNNIIFGLLFRPLASKTSKKLGTKKNRPQDRDSSIHRQSDDELCKEKLLNHVKDSHTDEFFTPRNGVCEVIPELPSPTKTLNGSVCMDLQKEDTPRSKPTIHIETHTPNNIEPSTKSMHGVKDASAPGSQFSCDARTPVVVGGENGVDLSPNETRAPHHVGDCADAHEFTSTSQSNVPVIIQTPPSPAIIVPKHNRYSLDGTQLFTDFQQSSDNVMRAVQNLPEGDLDEKDRQGADCQDFSSDVISPLQESSRGKEVINDHVNNTAIIIPSSDENVNSCKPNNTENLVLNLSSVSTEPSSLIGEHSSRDNCSIDVENNKNSFSPSLHHPNMSDSSPEKISNLESSSPLNSTSNCKSTVITDKGEGVEGLNLDNEPKSSDVAAVVAVADTPDSLSKSQQSPPLHLRPFWKVHEPSVGKFTVARIYNSDNHINSGKSKPSVNNNRNSLYDDDTADGSSSNQPHTDRQAPKQQFLSPMAAFEKGKSQTVSLYGINGYRSQHPHHHHEHNNMRRRHHQHRHHHSFYELGGSRVEIAENLSNGVSRHTQRGSSSHLAAYHYFGSMASFGAAVTRRGSAENVDVTRNSAETKTWEEVLNRWFPTRLLKDPVFILLLIGFVMWTGQSITMTYLPAYAVSLGIDRSEAAYLISIIGIANVVFRPVAGLITDCMSIPSIWLYFFALLLAAVVNFIIPMCKSYHLLAACAAVFGLCMAVAVSMRTIVLVDQMGLDALTESFGIVALFQGIAFIIFPPIAGSMIDKFKSSKPTFWMSAAMYTISATMMLGAICLGNRRKRSDSNTVREADV